MKYLFWVKDKIKLYRAMFRQYSATSSKGKTADTFDTKQKQTNLMSLGSLNSFLADFKVSKYEFAKVGEIKQIISLINNKLEMHSNSNKYLNLEGFIEFLLQLGYFMFFDLTTRPSEFLPLLFRRMRHAAYASTKPMFQAQFEELTLEDEIKEPEMDDELDNDDLAQLLKELTHEVNTNPKFVLPHGFIKVRADKIQEGYEPNKKKYPRESE